MLKPSCDLWVLSGYRRAYRYLLPANRIRNA